MKKTFIAVLLGLALAAPAVAQEYGLLNAHRFSYGVGGGVTMYQPADDQIGPARQNDGTASASLGWSSGLHGTLVGLVRYGFSNEMWQPRVAYSVMLNTPSENSRTVGIAAFPCFTWYDERAGYSPSRELGAGLSLSFPLLANALVGGSVIYGFETRSPEASLEIKAVGGFGR